MIYNDTFCFSVESTSTKRFGIVTKVILILCFSIQLFYFKVMGDFVVIPFQKGDISCMFENRQYILLPKIMLRARISSSFGASCTT